MTTATFFQRSTKGFLARACLAHDEESNMDMTISRPLPSGHRALRAHVTAATYETPALSPMWRKRGENIRRWVASRRVQVALVIGLLGVERAAALVFGIDLFAGFGAGAGLLLAWGIGHCDTMDGPLVMLGVKALDDKNVNVVLPWVRAEDEPEIRHAFDHAQAVRDLGPEARSLADRHFLETLVRIHRAGEGAPFTGLKPAGLDLGPAVPAADRALQTGSADAVIKLLVDAVSEGVRERFRTASERQGFDTNDVASGRRYVEAYVPYVHYVEQLWDAATAAGHGHSAGHGAGAHRDGHAAHQH
jgi:hypothetical protein